MNNGENNAIVVEREVNIILSKIRDTCKLHNDCNYCPYFIKDTGCLVLLVFHKSLEQ